MESWEVEGAGSGGGACQIILGLPSAEDATHAAVQYAVTLGNFAFSVFVNLSASRRAEPAGIWSMGV